jgi:hypothetical protein
MIVAVRRRMAMRLGLVALLGALGIAVGPAPGPARGPAPEAFRPCPGFACGDNHNQVLL